MTFSLLNLARIMGVLLLAAGLCGCSAVKLGYNAGAQAAYWWLDGYVDFSDTQSQRVREDLARLHQWHRESELPRYADMLARMEQLGAADISPAQACALFGELRERLEVTARQAEPAVMALATSLAPRQLEHLERQYAKSNTQYQSEWITVSPAQVRDKRLKQLVERAEMIYGRLDEAQHQAIRQQVEKSTFDPARLLAERQRRQQDLLATLRKLPGQPAAQAGALMRGYLERLQHSPNPAQAAYQEGLIQEGCAAFAAVHNSTTPAQRDAAARRLRAYQRDLRELAAQR